MELVQKSHDELAVKKQTETEIISKELNLVGIKHKDAKSTLIHVDKELSETKD